MKSPLIDCCNIIINNILYNAHAYSCDAYQNNGICNCESYTDLEIANVVLETYGYKLVKLDEQ